MNEPDESWYDLSDLELPAEHPRTADGEAQLAEYERAAKLREAVQRFQRESERITRAHGLSLQRYVLLLVVRTGRAAPSRATLAELMDRLGLAQSTVVELVSRAEGAGLVRREHGETNRRLVYVALTETGAALLADVVAELALHRKRLVSILSRLD